MCIRDRIEFSMDGIGHIVGDFIDLLEIFFKYFIVKIILIPDKTADHDEMCIRDRSFTVWRKPWKP